MQEEVLRLVLLALEDGSALSRKVLVMFIVQNLEQRYPQSSKTSVGHVVQLLYRASCFHVSKDSLILLEYDHIKLAKKKKNLDHQLLRQIQPSCSLQQCCQLLCGVDSRLIVVLL